MIRFRAASNVLRLMIIAFEARETRIEVRGMMGCSGVLHIVRLTGKAAVG